MSKRLKNVNKKSSFLFCIISMMCLSALPIVVNAGIVPPDDDPPPGFIDCTAQARVYRNGNPKFTFRVVAKAVVHEIYGNPVLAYCYFLFDHLDLNIFDNYVSDVLSGRAEYYYNWGSQRVGYNQTIEFRICNQNNGNYVDFELSACVHLWY
ncbi:MAG: hypothetical protein ACFFDF_25850, partial [Candidatus Odinarchaeota archaeon]